MILPSIKELLAYKNEEVVRHFLLENNHPIDLDTAWVIFQDLLAWMWLSTFRQKKNRDSFLFGPLLPLDKMWHVFILHTESYHQFCNQYFGEYFHHRVEPIGFEHELSAEELADFLNDCFDYLEEDWVMRNFDIVM